ncbi:carboxypeptidase regulatory-like domain-containing protein [Thalassolituus alkanivorans]|uniref:carboxypeptidase regulatory-like domain-containing protein n=1 Tax=Thalassolituus alkanivorans TaxID=2881055 RepID=UPI001E5FE3D2|nr:carboxypeptidase regulatory-like domain-containing protein [Thalassolituus alkanivorans]MCB2386545.1 carboxypeptidase-like regulatory domain-containing protein [Thalassolituus alkanivorans]MCB2423028.1 carboxypeptidase-like regulatory domain-containing protein [Thalassolituus alkanivorans]
MKAYSILILAGLLAACGGGSGSSGNSGGGDNSTPPGNYTPVTQNLSQLSLLDASGKPLSEAQVTISPKNTAGIAVAAVLASNSVQLTADSNGHITFPDLAPGSYTLTITISGVTVTTTLEIRAENASGSSTVAAPLVITDNGAESLEGQGFFASLSGIIFDADGPLNNAQIEISGGAATNGAIATATTDNDGHFVLIVNVSLSKLLAIKTATIRISRDGYGTRVIPLDLTQISALSGLNFSLQAATGNSDALYSENFEQPVSEAACGSWMTVSVSQSYTGAGEGPGPLATLNAEETPAEEADEELQNLWHSHNAGLNIINQALVSDLVLLAPDDTSAGKVPDPLSNRACWYGQAASGGVTQGNFLGEPEEPQEELDGGTSLTPNGGAIVSPDIDLSAETGPLSLTFRTWWEIEAVNPNENGFDLMTIEYSIDDIQWTPIARLNPLSDPVGLDDQDRAPLPYSNRGYNKAPAWLWQEPIDISDLAGEQIKLRFRFNTQDELYNGFRGWLVDDISIKREAGTFPRYLERETYLQPTFSPMSQTPVIAGEVQEINIGGEYTYGTAATLKLIQVNSDGSQTVLATQQVEQNDAIELAASITAPDSGFVLLAFQVSIDDQTSTELRYDLYYPVVNDIPAELSVDL